MKKKPTKLTISHGVIEPLSKVPFHMDVIGITRRLLISPEDTPEAPLHIAVHEVRVDSANRGKCHYAEDHKHNSDEVNIVWSERGKLQYRFVLDGKETIVESPAIIVIPAGITHHAEALSGEGTFTCILLNAQHQHT